MRTILDWLDEITDGDRQSIRMFLVIIGGFVLILAADWGWSELRTPDCDEVCRREAEQFVCATAAELCDDQPPATFSPQKFINETLRPR